MRCISVLCGLAVILCVSSVAVACKCLPPPPPKAALEKAAAVFAGKVTAIEKLPDGFTSRVTFVLSKTWKGTEGKTVTVETAISSATCGYGFMQGKSYLVYCYATAADENEAKNLQTGLCTRTTPLASADEDLKALGEGQEP